MRFGIGEDENFTENSSSHSSSLSSSSASPSSVGARPSASSDSTFSKRSVNFVEERLGSGTGEWMTDELIRGDATGALASPNLISVAGSSSSLVNFAQRFRVGAGETIDVEQVQVLHVNRRFTVPAVAPMLQSPPGLFQLETSFSHGGSELITSTFPTLNNSWRPEPMRNPYTFHCFPYENVPFSSDITQNLKRKLDFPGNRTLNNSWRPEPMRNPYTFHRFPYENVPFSSAITQNLKRKVDFPGNPDDFESLPVQSETLFPHMTGSLYHDSVFPCTSGSTAALPQHHLFPAAGRDIFMNYCIAEPPKLEATKIQEMNVLSTSQDFRIGNHLGTSVPARKQKMVRPKRESSLSSAAVPGGNKNIDIEQLSKHEFHNLQQSALDVIPSLMQTSVPPSVYHSAYLNYGNLCGFEDGKELERRGWMVILQKELRNSDVGSLGRIVLPKKDAEANLPPLPTKDGLILHMEDMVSTVIWEFKYRYWPNNKSRMYVMENTGDFVNLHNLQTGDFFIICKDESSGKYIVGSRKVFRPSNTTDLVEWNCKDQSCMVKEENMQLSLNEGGTNAHHQLHQEQRASVLIDNFLIPKIESDDFVMSGLFDCKREIGGSSQYAPPEPGVNPDANSIERFLP